MGALLLAVPVDAVAWADAPSASGYWVKEGAPIPTVPPGGLLVANDPTSVLAPSTPVGSQLPGPGALPTPSHPGPQQSDVIGPTAISALQILGVSATAPVTLTLEVASGSVVPSPALTTIVACPLVASLRSPPRGGDISSAPPYSCASQSPGIVASDGMTISWLLPSAYQLAPGELDVALVPNPTGQPVAFSVAFDSPDPTAFEMASGPSYPAPGPSGSPSVQAPGGTSAMTVPATPVPASGASAALAGEAPVDGLASAPLPATISPGEIPEPVTRIAAVGGPGERGLFSGVALGSSDRGQRILAVLVLFGLLGAWWYVGGGPAYQPRLLRAFGGNEPPPGAVGQQGGVGRFKRPRVSRPRSL